MGKIIVIVVVTMMLFMLASCKKDLPPKERLEQMGIPFTVEEFHKRIHKKDYIAVNLLLEAGIHVDEASGIGPGWEKGRYDKTWSALILAVMLDDIEMVKLLLKHGANINYYVKDPNPNEPGMGIGTGYALNYVSVTKPEMLKLLLENGANPNINGVCFFDSFYKDTCSWNWPKPPDESLKRKMEESIRLLIKHGANLNCFDNSSIENYRKTPMNYENCPENLKRLIREHGAKTYNEMKEQGLLSKKEKTL